MLRSAALAALAFALCVTASLLAQEATNGANGKLQIHYINVGQGDAQLIVSPLGETMLIDSGPASSQACASATGLITYLANAGVSRLDYHVASHYDADHIGCSDVVIGRWPVQVAALDRGTTSAPGTQTYSRYAAAAATKRQTAVVGQVVTLDASSSTPTRFTVIAVNGNGTAGTLSENDRSVVLRLSFGNFDALFGGDIAGQTANGNHDLESLPHHHTNGSTAGQDRRGRVVRDRVSIW